MRARWLWALAASLGPQLALAHTLPATLGVVGSQGGEPFALRLAHGLALHQEDGWRFVCPTRWGGPALATAAGPTLGPAELWVIGPAGPVRIGPDGQSHRLTVPALLPAAVRRLIALPGAVVALSVDAAGSSLWRLAQDSAERIYQAPEGAESIATDGQQIFVGHTTPEAIVVDVLGAGPPERRRFAAAELEGRTLALEYAGGALWARLSDGQGARLLRLADGQGSLMLSTDRVLLGPVDQGGRALVAVDQALHTVDEGGLVPVATSTAVSCLGGDAGIAFGCSNTRLFALVAPPEERFSIAELLGPELAGLDRDTALSCQLEWLDLATEAGLDPRAAPAEPAAPAAPAALAEPEAEAPPPGCRCVQLRPSLAGPLLLAVLGLARRGRQRPSPGIKAAGDSGRGRQPPPL